MDTLFWQLLWLFSKYIRGVFLVNIFSYFFLLDQKPCKTTKFCGLRVSVWPNFIVERKNQGEIFRNHNSKAKYFWTYEHIIFLARNTFWNRVLSLWDTLYIKITSCPSQNILYILVKVCCRWEMHRTSKFYSLINCEISSVNEMSADGIYWTLDVTTDLRMHYLWR